MSFAGLLDEMERGGEVDIDAAFATIMDGDASHDEIKRFLALTVPHMRDPAWIAALTRLVGDLRSTGAQVLVLGPVPDPQTTVPICLSGHLDDVTACSPSRSTAVNQPGINAEAAATEAGGGHYADLTELFCTTDRCPVIVGDTLVYLDQNHLTIEYAQLLAPAIGTLADRTLAVW
jgi:hypothetical protein